MPRFMKNKIDSMHIRIANLKRVNNKIHVNKLPAPDKYADKNNDTTVKDKRIDLIFNRKKTGDEVVK